CLTLIGFVAFGLRLASRPETNGPFPTQRVGRVFSCSPFFFLFFRPTFFFSGQDGFHILGSIGSFFSLGLLFGFSLCLSCSYRPSCSCRHLLSTLVLNLSHGCFLFSLFSFRQPSFV